PRMTKPAEPASAARVSATTAPASRALTRCFPSRSQTLTLEACLTRCFSIARPIRPDPPMPNRPLASVKRASVCLCLQHGGERVARIDKLGRIDRHAALDQPARRRDVALGIDAEDIGQTAAVELEAQQCVRPDLAARGCAAVRQRPAGALDVE